MFQWKLVKRAVAVCLAAALVTVQGGVTDGWAMLAPAQGVQNSPERLEDLETAQKFLHQKVVQQRLVEYGLTEAEARARLGRLTDQELRQVALQIDAQNPGGDGGGLLITVLVVGVLVLMFMYFAKRV